MKYSTLNIVAKKSGLLLLPANIIYVSIKELGNANRAFNVGGFIFPGGSFIREMQPERHLLHDAKIGSFRHTECLPERRNFAKRM
jgi:hypothetical protein